MSPHPLINKVRAARSKLSHWALVPGVVLMSSPVFAALPTMPTPGSDMKGNAVAAGDWMGSMSAWFKAGLAILGLVILAFMFFKVVGGAVTKWGEYTKGRADIADLKEYLIMGIIIVGFAILMVTYAFQVIGET
jgi:integrating conjugative element membrane protein (TIGR03745 family)